MNIHSERRYAWPDLETADRGSYDYCEAEVGYLAAQLLLPRELPCYQHGTSGFWQRLAGYLRYWLPKDYRGLPAGGGGSGGRLRAVG